MSHTIEKGPQAELPSSKAENTNQPIANDENSQQDRDLEDGKTHTSTPEDHPKDPNLVTWDGPADPSNPKNWPNKAKWTHTVAVSIFTFISPVSSSMIAPALASVGRDLNMPSDFEVNLSLSIFILAYAIGPIFFGPASETWGRVRPLQLSNLWYLAWNLGCGFATNKAEMFVFRFLAGIGGSAPLAIGGGALSDVWITEERGKAMGIYALAPILGPVLGPIAGGWIAERTTWRWVFWSSSALAGVIQLVGLIWLRESYPAITLKKKRDRLVKETGNEDLYVENDSTKIGSTLRGALIRPARMFTTQPIVQVISLYLAYIFGIMYLLLATFPVVWGDVYGENSGISGLNYASIAIGSFLGIVVNFALIDRIYRRLKAKNDGVGRPEFRIPSMFVGSLLITVGLFWYGWAVQGHVHWIVPNIGIAIFSGGSMTCLYSMQTYTVDSYTRYAASAMAAVAVLRSLAGFAFPLFAPYLYQRLGYGWGTSVLAFISIGIGFPAPCLFWFYGEKLRAMSEYARS